MNCQLDSPRHAAAVDINVREHLEWTPNGLCISCITSIILSLQMGAIGSWVFHQKLEWNSRDIVRLMNNARLVCMHPSPSASLLSRTLQWQWPGDVKTADTRQFRASLNSKHFNLNWFVDGWLVWWTFLVQWATYAIDNFHLMYLFRKCHCTTNFRVCGRWRFHRNWKQQNKIKTK